MNQTIPDLEKKYQISILLQKNDATNTRSYERLQEKAVELSVGVKSFPVLIYKSIVLQGNAQIDGEIDSLIKKSLADDFDQGSADRQLTRTNPPPSSNSQLALIPALAAGLIDGINPCAFSTLISLVIALGLAGKRKKQILAIGLVFSASVMVTYYLVGLGMFQFLSALEGFVIISQIIRWCLFGVLILFAFISVYDYVQIRRGKMDRIVLQLPDYFKKKIKSTIKVKSRSSAIYLSAIILGFLVSIFELGCTGQVYFPFITYTVGIDKSGFAYFILLVYNLAFIVPLLVVFILSYFGVSSGKFTAILQKHMGKTKISLALLFIFLAILTFVK